MFRKRKELGAVGSAEARWAFLLDLDDRLRDVANAEQVQFEAAQALGQQLNAARVGYAEAQGDGETLLVLRNFSQGVPAIEGRFRYRDLGAELVSAMRHGQTFVRDDLAHDTALSEAEKANYAKLNVAAMVNVRLVKGGRLLAMLFVHDSRPRRWTDEEVELIEDVAARTWDAVERARAEAALRDSDHKYRTLCNSIDAGFCIIEMLWDKDGRPSDFRYIEANPAFAEHSGIVDPVGRRVRELVPGLDTHWFEIFGRIARTGTPEHFERSAHALGRVYEISAFRLEPAEQGRVGVLFRDVSERKQAEGRLKESGRRKDEFLAVLGHELRNPLAPLRTGLELLQQAPDRSPLLDKVLPLMDRQLAHLTRLVDDLLDVARVSRGRIELRRTLVDLREPLEAALEQTRSLVDSREHELIVNLPSRAVPVQGDFERLTQVFSNLLTNAAKYSGSRGEIRVGVTAEQEQAVVRVRDTGYGIPPDRIDTIFTLFNQVPEHRTLTGGQGLGIGLALSRRLVEMHGGTLSAHSDGLGTGSEFVVRLPLAMPSRCG